jgi:hypothetical protein
MGDGRGAQGGGGEKLCCGEFIKGSLLFIAGLGAVGVRGGRPWRRRSAARRVKLRCAACRRLLGGAIERVGVANDGRERAGVVEGLRYGRGRFSMMATATRLPRASEHVQELAGGVVMARA